ncbi:GxxExxY protein [Flaviaesturariibacter flavus]|uniref:GxxExxY protein n=1 Tax=Flaviaesturariibacter flavus TaxID=2502780 RepID=A0A4R1B9K6_9BACT|nr:GxxExxY protein [Flaviaesturariibacter flavus]TCJ13601.1 GxxExxY protein [Flaviaesturariibacter flavus]
MITDQEVIAAAILDVAYYLHRLYGPGLLESIYEDLMEYELKKRGFHVQRQQHIPLVHESLRRPRACRADLIVNHTVLVELKSQTDLHKEYYRTVISYLRLSRIRLGLLINFGVPLLRDGIRRVVNDFIIPVQE